MKNSLLSCLSAIALLAACGRAVSHPAGPSGQIRINQIGFYPGSVKEFLVTDPEASSFRVVTTSGKVVLEGELRPTGTWEASGENVLVGDLSALEQPGTYRIMLDTDAPSYPFEIREKIYSNALDASIKSYYFQRASMDIPEKYGGIHARAGGHPDDSCLYHPSTGHKGGYGSSPGGWYDAGDYGKYIVNAALSVGQMLNLLELYPGIIPDGRLNIPESGNGTGDLMDELRYELDWMTTMQDSDGGVFHKLTAKNFGGFIMPADYHMERYFIGKSTAASLTFAASMAQAARIFRESDQAFAEKATAMAAMAWQWSQNHPGEVFRNPGDVHTGGYGDSHLSDEFFWAAVELYLTTGEEPYLEYLVQNQEPYIHQITNSWMYFTRNVGFHSLLANRDKLDPGLAGSLVEKHLLLADGILNKIDSIPYRVGLDHFEWGSNSDVLNQAVILCYAHYLTGKRKYLDGAIRNTDYIFGKNATGTSFLTGYGANPAMNPHHRPSGADGIEEPVPGFIVGGPNMHMQDRREVDYTSTLPAKAYMDVQASYASNEVCLNWNAPAVFVLGYLEEQGL